KAQHQERLVIACDKAFEEFQVEFSERYEVFRDLVQSLAVLDCLFSLATVACLPGYVKPEYIDDDDDEENDEERYKDGSKEQDEDGRLPLELKRGTDMDTDMNMDLNKETSPQVVDTKRRVNSRTTLDIKNGRHPMVEQLLASSSGASFVPNDVQFGRVRSTDSSNGMEVDGAEKSSSTTPVAKMEDQKTIVLTGPNMGGKSCYIRQVALLCIMAQIGSYLPADSARVSLLDAVYTRMGASDNIVGHESTFMVELQETSDILKMATARSLVILDELGRGTSTLDGVAIAYAVLKHVVSQIGAITLFVTHYPSLAEVADEFAPGVVRKFHMGFMATGSSSSNDGGGASPETTTAAGLDDSDIVFLYKLVPGVSLKSYGLNVARLAGLSPSLIHKAKVKSKELEQILEQRVQIRQQEAERAKLTTVFNEIMHCSTTEEVKVLWEHLFKD
ncbi:Mismatch repair protein msh3, partial [Podila epigama]